MITARKTNKAPVVILSHHYLSAWTDRGTFILDVIVCPSPIVFYKTNKRHDIHHPIRMKKYNKSLQRTPLTFALCPDTVENITHFFGVFAFLIFITVSFAGIHSIIISIKIIVLANCTARLEFANALLTKDHRLISSITSLCTDSGEPFRHWLAN